MAIDFSPSRWDEVRKTYKAWWAGELKRPIVPVELFGRTVNKAEPKAPLLSQSTVNRIDVSVEDLVDRIDYELSSIEYLGDAFPRFDLAVFGPGVVAAFLGATLDNSTGRVWFHPKQIVPISELTLSYDSNNFWLNRIKEFCAAAMKRWQGQVLVGMPDLGGVLDILATFRTSEGLLYDMYDEPEHVKRLVKEIRELWFRFYREINEILQPINPGYSDWSSVYSEKPSYILQSDFCYMIGPEMFSEFAEPCLKQDCVDLEHTIYHLDGKGELVHLEKLLKIKELKGVQWVPGTGNPDYDCWPEIYRKIADAGKLIHIPGGSMEVYENIIKQLNGVGKGIQHLNFRFPISERAEVIKKLNRLSNNV